MLKVKSKPNYLPFQEKRYKIAKQDSFNWYENEVSSAFIFTQSNLALIDQLFFYCSVSLSLTYKKTSFETISPFFFFFALVSAFFKHFCPSN